MFQDISKCVAAVLLVVLAGVSMPLAPMAQAGVFSCGDVNRDGLVNYFDVSLVMDIVVGTVSLEAEHLVLGDVVRDNKLNIYDLVLLSRAANGMTVLTVCGPGAPWRLGAVPAPIGATVPQTHSRNDFLEIPLAAGWSGFSLPQEPKDPTALRDSLADIEKRHTVEYRMGSMLTYHPDMGWVIGSYDDLRPGVGYAHLFNYPPSPFVEILKFQGIPNPNPSPIPLKGGGWNFVGMKSKQAIPGASYPVDLVFRDLPGVQLVSARDPLTKERVQPDHLVEGRAYFVYSTVDAAIQPMDPPEIDLRLDRLIPVVDPVTGELSMKVRIVNDSAVDVTHNFLVNLYASPTAPVVPLCSIPATPVASCTVWGGLDAGSAHECSFPVSPPPDTRMLQTVVDADCRVNDGDRGNNTATEPLFVLPTDGSAPRAAYVSAVFLPGTQCSGIPPEDPAEWSSWLENNCTLSEDDSACGWDSLCRGTDFVDSFGELWGGSGGTKAFPVFVTAAGTFALVGTAPVSLSAAGTVVVVGGVAVGVVWSIDHILDNAGALDLAVEQAEESVFERAWRYSQVGSVVLGRTFEQDREAVECEEVIHLTSMLPNAARLAEYPAGAQDAFSSLHACESDGVMYVWPKNTLLPCEEDPLEELRCPSLIVDVYNVNTSPDFISAGRFTVDRSTDAIAEMFPSELFVSPGLVEGLDMSIPPDSLYPQSVKTKDFMWLEPLNSGVCRESAFFPPGTLTCGWHRVNACVFDPGIETAFGNCSIYE